MSDKSPAYYACERSEMLAFVPAHATRILDIGCGTGRFAELLKGRNGCEVWGIEPDAEAGAIAKRRLDRLITGFYPHITGLPTNYFDCVVFNDVLEHMPNPWLALEETRRYLAPTGTVVASIPNVRYLPLLYQLVVRGEWEYAASGVLDRTHLRFFTKKSMLTLFHQTGYEVLHIEGIYPYHRWQKPLLRLLLPRFSRDTTYIDYALVARPQAR